MLDLLLTVSYMIWIPLIPLRLLIQASTSLWKKMGDWSYLIYFIYWVGINIVVFTHREVLHSYRYAVPPMISGIGFLITLMALWLAYDTAQTLGLVTLSMRPQMSPGKVKANLVITGPYRFVRHPFYFSEWVGLLGLVLATGSHVLFALFLLALVFDPIVTLFEEKELRERFGISYVKYQQKVPRILPRFSSIKGGS